MDHTDEREHDNTATGTAGSSQSSAQDMSSPPPPSRTPLTALFPPLYVPRPHVSSSTATTPTADHNGVPQFSQSCISMCSQSSSRRAESLDPICRMICFKVNPSPPKGWESDAQRVRRQQRSAVRRWIDEREVMLFRGTLSDLRDVQRESEEGDKLGGKGTKEEEGRRRRRRKVEEEGGWVVDRRQISELSTITHIPLTSLLLSPYHRVSRSLSTLLTPSHRLITSYVDSFSDGTQSRVAAAAWAKATNGEVWEFGRRLGKRVIGVWVGPRVQEEQERGNGTGRERRGEDGREKSERKD